MGVDERVSYSAAERKVKEALAAYESTGSGRSSSAAVPTEFLGADNAVLTIPPGRRPGCGFRLIAKCPLLVVLFVFAVCAAAGAGVFFMGDLNLSVQTELFQHSDNEAVNRASMYVQIGYTDVGSKRRYYERRLAAPEALAEAPAAAHGGRELTHLADRSTIVCDHPFTDQWGEPVIMYEVVYTAKDGHRLLAPETLQRILLAEQSMRRWIEESGACEGHRASQQGAGVGGRTAGGFCEPLDSSLNYFFPSAMPSDSGCASPGGRRCLRFDGAGFGEDTMTLRAGTRCEPALLQSEIDEVFGWLVSEGRTGFFSRGPRGNNNTALNYNDSSNIRHLRTRMAFPQAWQSDPAGMTEHGLGFMAVLNEAIDDVLMVQTDL